MAGLPAAFDEEYHEEEGRTLPYGITPRTVYYVCLKCGRKMSAEELKRRPALACIYCGYRVLIKERAPPEAIKTPRRVYAV